MNNQTTRTWGREPLWLPILKTVGIALLIGVPVVFLSKLVAPWYGANSGVAGSTRLINYAISLLSVVTFAGFPIFFTWLMWSRKAISSQGDVHVFTFPKNWGLEIREQKLGPTQRRYEQNGPIWPLSKLFVVVHVDDTQASGPDTDFNLWWLRPSDANKLLTGAMLSKDAVPKKNGEEAKNAADQSPDSWAVKMILDTIELFIAKYGGLEDGEKGQAAMRYIKNIQLILKYRNDNKQRELIEKRFMEQRLEDTFQL